MFELICLPVAHTWPPLPAHHQALGLMPFFVVSEEACSEIGWAPTFIKETTSRTTVHQRGPQGISSGPCFQASWDPHRHEGRWEQACGGQVDFEALVWPQQKGGCAWLPRSLQACLHHHSGHKPWMQRASSGRCRRKACVGAERTQPCFHSYSSSPSAASCSQRWHYSMWACPAAQSNLCAHSLQIDLDRLSLKASQHLGGQAIFDCCVSKGLNFWGWDCALCPSFQQTWGRLLLCATGGSSALKLYSSIASCCK